MFIRGIKLNKDFFNQKNKDFPFNLVFLNFFKNEYLELKKPITFFVGENGSGKTTLIESIAFNLGLNKYGGSKNFKFIEQNKPILSSYLKLIKSTKKETDAFFLRAENFFNLENELKEYSESSRLISSYTGSEKNFREMSHGQGFKAFFENRVGKNGIYIFDEPEAALSIQSQIEFLFVLKELSEQNNQIIIITHSPIILSFPNSQIFEINDTIKEIKYQDSSIYIETKNFLEHYKRFQKELEFKDN